MDGIDLSIEGVEVIFKPSEIKPPEHLRSWTLYDVYVEGKYMGLATDTGERPTGRDKSRMWRALEGDAYQVGEALNRDEIAGAFVRWYYGSGGGSAGEK